MPDDIEFGDSGPDDSYSAGDDKIDWSRVEELKEQIDEIQEIEDSEERLEAAKAWAIDLQGDT